MKVESRRSCPSRAWAFWAGLAAWASWVGLGSLRAAFG
jgi:hypothetical protein